MTIFSDLNIFMGMKKVKRYAGILVKTKDECLLCKRNSKGEMPGEWSIPAGHIEKNEPPLIGAKREFYEETHQKVKGDIRLIGFIRRKNREGKKDKGLLYLFLWDSDEKIIPNLSKAKDGEEHTECKYFKKDEIPIGNSNHLYSIIQKVLN